MGNNNQKLPLRKAQSVPESQVRISEAARCHVEMIFNRYTQCYTDLPKSIKICVLL